MLENKLTITDLDLWAFKWSLSTLYLIECDVSALSQHKNITFIFFIHAPGHIVNNSSLHLIKNCSFHNLLPKCYNFPFQIMSLSSYLSYSSVFRFQSHDCLLSAAIFMNIGEKKQWRRIPKHSRKRHQEKRMYFKCIYYIKILLKNKHEKN